MMNRISIILLFGLLALVSCKREEDNRKGEAVIDNRLYESELSYYAMGFHFVTASLTRTDGSPFPDITLIAETGAGGVITSVVFNGPPALNSFPFSLYGSYQNENAAVAAFDDIKSFEVSDFTWSELGRLVAENQIWLYRSTESRYAKLVVLEVITEERDGLPYAECSFRWVYQPDGTATFPY
ncbi:MAG: hypothetical protein R6W67_06185 [Bacteroidales bacterium]